MLDEIDLKIIQKLAKNGRMSLTELSEGLEISRVAVASRIDKLIKTNLLQISARLSLDKLNYQTLLVEMQIDNSKLAEFKKFVERAPKILHSFEITGPYNYLLICSAKNNKNLRQFIETDLKRFAKDCKITLSSNPQTPEHVHVKALEEI